ncbi:uncharacterized protein TNCV_2279111 [Trichonephila clavipes]|uniref:Transposase n=1 Tax=Trichonephila clavipes TaxID=2585209 RepID=A0A8X6UYN2_TRICX|nr:uncharacterized protein TNCV_2279111 [Trichonephila clavipes]
MMIGCHTTPDDSAVVVGSKAGIIKELSGRNPDLAKHRKRVEKSGPFEQVSDLASHLSILAFQSVHFVNKFLASTIAASTFKQLCLYVADGDRFNSCQGIYSQFGLAIHQNDHKARRRFAEWAQNEIAVVLDFHKRILFSDEAHFWLNGYVNKQNCRIWSEANPQVYVETPLHPEKLTVWCALWAGGIIGPYFFNNDEGPTTLQSMVIGIEP